jgi:hypothetical protein
MRVLNTRVDIFHPISGDSLLATVRSNTVEGLAELAKFGMDLQKNARIVSMKDKRTGLDCRREIQTPVTSIILNPIKSAAQV